MTIAVDANVNVRLRKVRRGGRRRNRKIKVTSLKENQEQEESDQDKDKNKDTSISLANSSNISDNNQLIANTSLCMIVNPANNKNILQNLDNCNDMNLKCLAVSFTHTPLETISSPAVRAMLSYSGNPVTPSFFSSSSYYSSPLCNKSVSSSSNSSCSSSNKTYTPALTVINEVDGITEPVVEKENNYSFLECANHTNYTNRSVDDNIRDRFKIMDQLIIDHDIKKWFQDKRYEEISATTPIDITQVNERKDEKELEDENQNQKKENRFSDKLRHAVRQLEMAITSFVTAALEYKANNNSIENKKKDHVTSNSTDDCNNNMALNSINDDTNQASVLNSLHPLHESTEEKTEEKYIAFMVKHDKDSSAYAKMYTQHAYHMANRYCKDILMRKTVILNVSHSRGVGSIVKHTKNTMIETKFEKMVREVTLHLNTPYEEDIPQSKKEQSFRKHSQMFTKRSLDFYSPPSITTDLSSPISLSPSSDECSSTSFQVTSNNNYDNHYNSHNNNHHHNNNNNNSNSSSYEDTVGRLLRVLFGACTVFPNEKVPGEVCSKYLNRITAYFSVNDRTNCRHLYNVQSTLHHWSVIRKAIEYKIECAILDRRSFIILE